MRSCGKTKQVVQSIVCPPLSLQIPKDFVVCKIYIVTHIVTRHSGIPSVCITAYITLRKHHSSVRPLRIHPLTLLFPGFFIMTTTLSIHTYLQRFHTTYAFVEGTLNQGRSRPLPPTVFAPPIVTCHYAQNARSTFRRRTRLRAAVVTG